MPRVTENLRRQWANARSQMVEERTEDQSGRPRSPEDVAVVDFDMAVMDALLALPLGIKFDAREIDAQVRTAFTFTTPAAPAPVAVVASVTTVTYDLEFRVTEDEAWFTKVPGFEKSADAWDHLDMLAAKPVYKDCMWQVVETRRTPVARPTQHTDADTR